MSKTGPNGSKDSGPRLLLSGFAFGFAEEPQLATADDAGGGILQIKMYFSNGFCSVDPGNDVIWELFCGSWDDLN